MVLHLLKNKLIRIFHRQNIYIYRNTITDISTYLLFALFIFICYCNSVSATEATTVNNATDTIAYTLTPFRKRSFQ